MQDAHESGFDQIEEALLSLREIRHSLRFSGVQLVYFTLATVAFSVVLGVGIYFRLNLLWVKIFLLLLAGSVTASVVFAIMFESVKKRGDAVFKELSDELQWHVRFEKVRDPFPPASPPESRPGLSTRVALREFALSTDLPLIPGRYGPGIYVAINLIILLSTIVPNFFFWAR